MRVEDSHVETKIIEYRLERDGGDGDLLAVALTDVLSDGLSMVYSFYEPDVADRSLGTLMILDHIARARRMGLAYVYLGYWRSEEHTSELQSHLNLVCRLLLEKKKNVVRHDGLPCLLMSI